MKWTELYVLVCVQILLLACATKSECDSSNATIPEICQQQSNNSISCTEFSGECLECMWPDCKYGDTVNVTCMNKYEGIECTGEQLVTREAVCQYCYQGQERVDYICSNDTNCKVQQTPRSTYIAQCQAVPDLICMGCRIFQKRKICNFATGTRWTTAMLLSITLGGFGVDRFYLEHWGSAIGKLLSFGGLGVWTILDVILIATGYLGPADGSLYIY